MPILDTKLRHHSRFSNLCSYSWCITLKNSTFFPGSLYPPHYLTPVLHSFERNPFRYYQCLLLPKLFTTARDQPFIKRHLIRTLVQESDPNSKESILASPSPVPEIRLFHSYSPNSKTRVGGKAVEHWMAFSDESSMSTCAFRSVQTCEPRTRISFRCHRKSPLRPPATWSGLSRLRCGAAYARL